MIVIEQLKERVDVTPLGLEFLRHADQDDLTLVNRIKFERAFAGAKHFHDFRCEEVLQVVSDSLANAAELLFGLIQEAVYEMGDERGSARGFKKLSKVFNFFLKAVAV